MQRILFVLAIVTLFSFSGKAERILETVLDPANPQMQHVSYRGRVLIAGNSDTYLLVYNDITFSRLNYPLVGGVRLRFDAFKNPLTLFESAVFFVLTQTPGAPAPRYLYRLSGTTFSRIAITGNVISNCMVYGSSLYFLTDVAGTTRLFRYSGGVVTEVAGAAIPRATGYELHVAEGNMYITGYASRTGTVNFIRRYNGTSFLTLPWTGAGTNVDEVYGVPGTTRVYFTSHEQILYYNGVTVRRVFFNTGEGVQARMFGSNLYFTTGIGAHPTRVPHLYRLAGATLSEVLFPGGYQVAPVGATNPEVYDGALFVGAVHTGGGATVMRYDGTTFSSFFPILTPVGEDGIRLFLREGNLMIHPKFVNGNHAFEFNGTEFTKIIAPTDRLLFPYMSSTACSHLWLNYYSDHTGIHWAYGKEIKDCPPPPPGTTPVIPDHFIDYERFEMANLGPERGWCWSEIIIDWGIDTICPLPPCPDPNYELKMVDINNKVYWAEQFSKTSLFKVPLPDEQPFRTILTSLDKKTDLLVFEPELVPKGIDIIMVGMKPKEGILLLSASTRKNATVPLNVSLLNADGKILWEQTFTAPFAQEISARVNEPGKTLVFSIPDKELNFITKSKISHQKVLLRQ